MLYVAFLLSLKRLCGVCIQNFINFFRAWWPCLQSDQVHVRSIDCISVWHLPTFRWWCSVFSAPWLERVYQPTRPHHSHRGIQAVAPRCQPSCQMDEVTTLSSDLLNGVDPSHGLLLRMLHCNGNTNKNTHQNRFRGLWWPSLRRVQSFQKRGDGACARVGREEQGPDAGRFCRTGDLFTLPY